MAPTRPFYMVDILYGRYLNLVADQNEKKLDTWLVNFINNFVIDSIKDFMKSWEGLWLLWNNQMVSIILLGFISLFWIIKFVYYRM